jgi:hypothetical protein|tara:strand:- start:64 stop:318 length:255 start_codon:yes stop_codon:yes gene_type:complete
MGQDKLVALVLVGAVVHVPLAGQVIVHLYLPLREIPVGRVLPEFRDVIITPQMSVMVGVVVLAVVVAAVLPTLAEMGVQGHLTR